MGGSATQLGLGLDAPLLELGLPIPEEIQIARPSGLSEAAWENPFALIQEYRLDAYR